MPDESIINPDPGANDTANPGDGASWTDGLPEAIRGNEAFKGYKDMGAFAQKHLEILEAHSKAPKAPESADKYDLPAPEGDEEARKAFGESAFKAGMSQEQARAVWDSMQEFAKRHIDASRAEHEKSVEALKKEWPGTKWEENVTLAKRAETMLTRDAAHVIEWAKSRNLGSDPGFVRLLAFIGKAVSEDGGSIVFGDARKTTERQTTPGGLPMLDFPSMNKK